MLKRSIPLFVVFGFVGCSATNETVDYFGQKEPGSGPVIFAAEKVSVKGRWEHGISFAPDTGELAFGILDHDDFSGKIYHSKKTNDTWGEPRPFGPLKGKSAFLPYFSPNGKSLLYTQTIPDSANYVTNIWMMEKSGNTWKHPLKMNAPINTSARESMACMTLDNTIYFSSNRGGNGLADLFFSSPENSRYPHAERMAPISTERDEESIFVSPEGNYIIFSSYVDVERGPDLYITYKDSQRNWTKPSPLDTTINTKNWERRPFVSIDNKFLFFTKKIFDGPRLAESDIYWVSTQQVFKPFVFNPIKEKTIKVGEETILSLPPDYFKDVDDEGLEIDLIHKKIEWAEFNREKTTLTLNPDQIGEFELIVNATDKFSNKTEDRIMIIVVK